MIANRRTADTAQAGPVPKLPRRIYGVMAVTSLLTFATLQTGYQLFIATQLFA
jgi:hypothetical protein